MGALGRDTQAQVWALLLMTVRTEVGALGRDTQAGVWALLLMTVRGRFTLSLFQMPVLGLC